MKITVLMHENDPSVDRYIISALGDEWRSQGHVLEEQHGLSRPIRGDVVFLHVDLTEIPESYLRAVAGHPCVVNRRVADISKTRISRIRVRSPEEWEGPVIVKTVRNHGGRPERQIRRHTALGRIRNLLDKASWMRLEWAQYLNPRRYPIFDSVRDVPRGVFSNPHLIVERFLPERRGDLYCVRLYRFLGDVGVCDLIACREPCVGWSTSVERLRVPVHDEILALKEELGFQYGKFDYVIHDGRAIVLDVNRTPALRNLGRRRDVAHSLAPGLATVLG